MSNDSYDEILNRAKEELSREQKQKLAESLLQDAGRKKTGSHKITELRGLGKEIWQGVNADEYVAKERDAWGS
ncbi:MAG: hypothetical protein COA78_29970 [Blastopirellula sp.]|nr:MAG: hypothetical protein COA78_29970 [Blastopirellula sp.]